MDYVWACLLLAALAAGWVLTLFNLGGTWLMAVAAALYAWLVPADSRLSLGWGWVAALVALAALGELLEFLAGALGAVKTGGSKRGVVLAMIGSLIGGVLGAGAGLPIPLFGSVVGVIVGAALGALAGAMLGETWKGRSLGESWHVGQGAFIGRLLGTLSKVVAASIMALLPPLALTVRWLETVPPA